jgi:LysR family transcriptional regulator, regulator for bpeEF and oprC
MDKLRALEYFVAAASAHSFSGAARRLEVSVPAVAKLVAALEASLGARLFDRRANGLSLTADGERYLEACRPLLEHMAAADDVLRSGTAAPRGTVVVEAPPLLARHCILPALPRFHARYPDIQIDIRMTDRLTVTDAETSGIDVLVMLGWPDTLNLVQRRIARMRLVICAAPDYWAAHGVPQRPRDLERHVCLIFRDPKGVLLDLWEYERGGVKEAVAVSGWMVSDHRDVILDAVLAGEGVARFTELPVRAHLQSGRLVPVLLDWETKDAPPVNLLYRAGQRRTPRVRVFVEFLTDLFRRLEEARADSSAAQLPSERPDWYRRAYGRASARSRGAG